MKPGREAREELRRQVHAEAEAQRNADDKRFREGHRLDAQQLEPRDQHVAAAYRRAPMTGSGMSDHGCDFREGQRDHLPPTAKDDPAGGAKEIEPTLLDELDAPSPPASPEKVARPMAICLCRPASDRGWSNRVVDFLAHGNSPTLFSVEKAWRSGTGRS